MLTILNEHESEPVKAATHAALLSLVVVCAAYNWAAWYRRRHPHLFINGLLYTAATFWELYHVSQHCDSPAPSDHPWGYR